MVGLCRRLRCDEKECFEDEERIEDEEEKRERKRKEGRMCGCAW